MRRQQGQSAVEFALMAPIVMLLIFGAIYGGTMFMDYLNFSNEARTIARQIAVASDKTSAIAPYKVTTTNGQSTGGKTFARFYNVKITAAFVDDAGDEKPLTDATDVEVTVNFTRDNKDLPLVVYLTGFPPEKFRIVYRMKLEDN